MAKTEFMPIVAPSAAALRPEAFAADVERGLGGVEAAINIRKQSTRERGLSATDTLVARNSTPSIPSDASTASRDRYRDANSISKSSREVPSCECGEKCNGSHRILREDHNDYPLGFPRLAAFRNSSDSFCMYRRFGRTHCRLLSQLEGEITALEKRLDELDRSDDTPEMEYRLKRCSWDENWNKVQKDLMDELKPKLVEYGALLAQDSALRSLDRPPAHNYLALFNWMFEHKVLDEGHYDFVNHRDDMVYAANRTRQADGFDRLVEAVCARWPASPLQRWLRSGTEESSSSSASASASASTPDRPGQVVYFSARKILLLAKLIAILLSVMILLLPVFMLSVVSMKRTTATTLVLIFVLAFAAMVSVSANAKAETVFLSSCAYCAVLVTFLGNVAAQGVE